MYSEYISYMCIIIIIIIPTLTLALFLVASAVEVSCLMVSVLGQARAGGGVHMGKDTISNHIYCCCKQ